MERPIGWMTCWVALLAPWAAAAETPASLAELPVAQMELVDASAYRAAADLAARGRGPLEVALKVAGEFEGSTQHIFQVSEGAESPTVARVTVIRDGLLDDSVRGERWDISLTRTLAGAWAIKEVNRAWRCRRGAQVDRFVAAPCP